ncbi:hypothetical protein K1719_027534 [Acacia pycnantha]|nr:hypothetical protein K1719_027534 [Acacia pycnantha]
MRSRQLRPGGSALECGVTLDAITIEAGGGSSIREFLCRREKAHLNIQRCVNGPIFHKVLGENIIVDVAHVVRQWIPAIDGVGSDQDLLFIIYLVYQIIMKFVIFV